MSIKRILGFIDKVLVFGGLFFILKPGIAQQQDELDLASAYGGEEFVSIATGNQQPIYLAPAVTSVITAAEIKKKGATDLAEALESVPGLHVSRSTSPYNPIFQIRGIRSEFNPQVLVLVNGIPITNVFAGDRGQVWTGMPIQNISRIEVIRGPGSAVYGADAFAGVINVITKSAGDIDGMDIGFRAGSFDSQEGWLLLGRDWGDFDATFSFQYGETDGQREKIDADSQTFFDVGFGTSASLAPSHVNLGRKRLDTRLDIGTGDWRFRFGYQNRSDVGTGAGAAGALDPIGKGDSDFFNADLTYKNSDWFNDWDIEAELSFFNTSNRSNLVLFPPGAEFAGPFPDGVLGNPDVSERHYRANLSGLYNGFRNHRIRGGVGFRLEDLYKVEETKNFFIDENTLLATPLPGGLTDVSDTGAFVKETDRKIYYAFLQDEWQFMPDWTVTAGVRYDHYSDFGSTVNPRIALVWQTAYNLTSKLLYGRAFRAPSFQELFSENNPVVQGNPGLDPETIDSIELAFDYLPVAGFRSKLNLFYYHIDDILQFVSTATGAVAENTGHQTGYGLEFETSWEVMESVQFHGNYAYQNSRDDNKNEHVGFAPTHQIYGRADWQFFPGWNFDAQTNWVVDRKRSPGDPRSEIDDYVTVDLTLRGTVLRDKLQVAFSVRNVFDEDVREPSLASSLVGQQGSLIPNDLPLAGQSIYFEISLNMD